jgi:hypothetical protein
MAVKALLVGINDYAPVGAGGPDLRGCVPDVRDALSTFAALGVVRPIPGYLRILTDGRATKANILESLRWLLTPRAGVDKLIFYYSGHGTRVVDIEHDEPDGWDEAICPHDFQTAGVIKDDNFRTLFSTLKPNVTLEVILDSCFSGTGTREVEAMSALPEEKQVIPRYVDPPLDHGFFIDANPALSTKRQRFLTTTSRVPVVVTGMNHVLWSACRDNQTAGESNFGGIYRGVFSYCFFKALRRAGINVPRRRLDSIVTTAIHGMGYPQVPQLEGNPAELGQVIFRELVPEAMAA